MTNKVPKDSLPSLTNYTATDHNLSTIRDITRSPTAYITKKNIKIINNNNFSQKKNHTLRSLKSLSMRRRGL